MVLRELASLVVLMVSLAAAVGIGYTAYSGKPDNPIEEAAEEVIESQIENALGLPDDTINIDLSPGTPEERKES